MNDYKSWLEAKIEICKNEAHAFLGAPDSGSMSLFVNYSRDQLANYRRSLASVMEYEVEKRAAVPPGCSAAGLMIPRMATTRHADHPPTH